jgi:regulator of ribonuclease activity A
MVHDRLVDRRRSGEGTATADLVDKWGDALDSCDIQFGDYGGRARFDGTVTTLRCWHDNALLKATLRQPSRGRVLVVDGGGSLAAGLVGDVIGQVAVDNGWAGIIVYGAIRDVKAMRGLDLGVKALGSNPRASGKSGIGQRDVPIQIGSVRFSPGMLVFADEDGIVVTRDRPHAEPAERILT